MTGELRDQNRTGVDRNHGRLDERPNSHRIRDGQQIVDLREGTLLAGLPEYASDQLPAPSIRRGVAQRAGRSRLFRSRGDAARFEREIPRIDGEGVAALEPFVGVFEDRTPAAAAGDVATLPTRRVSPSRSMWTSIVSVTGVFVPGAGAGSFWGVDPRRYPVPSDRSAGRPPRPDRRRAPG